MDCAAANNDFLMKMFEMYRETNNSIINNLTDELCVYINNLESSK